MVQMEVGGKDEQCRRRVCRCIRIGIRVRAILRHSSSGERKRRKERMQMARVRYNCQVGGMCDVDLGVVCSGCIEELEA